MAHRARSRAEARILIVDDEPTNVELLERILAPEGYRAIASTTDARDVAGLCEAEPPDLVLLDLMMPHLDGFQVLDRLRAGSDDPPPVIVLTSDTSRQSKRRALAGGARDYLTKPLSPYEVRLRVANLVENRLLQEALHRHNETLEEQVRIRTRELEEARVQILERLAIAAEYHDAETSAHTRRVGEISARMAGRLGFSAASVELVRRAAPLHDVGKVGVPDAILRKPGELTPEEFDAMKEHAEIGERILAGSGIPLLDLAAEIAHRHHERWDGNGYPNGIAGEAIPFAARVVTVADVFDSLTHQRPYKPAWPRRKAIDHIRERSGTKFDPRVVEAFLDIEADGAS